MNKIMKNKKQNIPFRFFFSCGESATLLFFGSLPKAEVGRTKEDDGEKESWVPGAAEDDK